MNIQKKMSDFLMYNKCYPCQSVTSSPFLLYFHKHTKIYTIIQTSKKSKNQCRYLFPFKEIIKFNSYSIITIMRICDTNNSI